MLGLGVMVRRRWKDPAQSAVHTQDPKTKVLPRLKAVIGLMKTEAVEFAMRSSENPLPGAPAVGVLDWKHTWGVPEVDECDLAEIGNSKKEARGTQFRQVRAARCVIPYVMYVV
jgi:hypothetical protein